MLVDLPLPQAHLDLRVVAQAAVDGVEVMRNTAFPVEGGLFLSLVGKTIVDPCTEAVDQFAEVDKMDDDL